MLRQDDDDNKDDVSRCTSITVSQSNVFQQHCSRPFIILQTNRDHDSKRRQQLDLRLKRPPQNRWSAADPRPSTRALGSLASWDSSASEQMHEVPFYVKTCGLWANDSAKVLSLMARAGSRLVLLGIEPAA